MTWPKALLLNGEVIKLHQQVKCILSSQQKITDCFEAYGMAMDRYYIKLGTMISILKAERCCSVKDVVRYAPNTMCNT